MIDAKAPIHLGNGRLIILTVSALILSLSLVMSVFAPLPLALSFFLYEKKKAITCAALGMVVSIWLSGSFFESYVFALLYLFSFVIALLIVGIVKAKVKPSRGLVIGGLSFYVITLGLFMAAISALNYPLKERLTSEINKVGKELKKQEVTLIRDGGDEAIDTLASFAEPEKLAVQLLVHAPSYYFLILLFILWINLFLSLRARRLLMQDKSRIASEYSLLHFNVLDHVVWILAGSLFLAVWGTDLGFPALEIVGVSMIKMLGVFYFFQGFGIYVEFLNKLKIFGVMRTILVIFTVMTAYWLIALIGLFDMWANFRKILRKKS